MGVELTLDAGGIMGLQDEGGKIHILGGSRNLTLVLGEGELRIYI